MEWKDEIVERMEKLASRGCSASMIAETINHEYGADKTKDAVLGKCHRVGIELRGIPGPK